MGNSKQLNDESNLYQIVTNQILELLESQKLTWNKPWISITSDGKRPHNAGSGRSYSGMNQILLTFKRINANYPYNGWLTFKQIQDAGGRVMAGNKSSVVFHFKINFIDKDGRKYEVYDILKMSDRDQRELDLKKHSALMYYHVFNIAQTSGLSHSLYALNELPLLKEYEKDESAENLIHSTKAKIIHMTSNEACYNYVNDVIFLPDRMQFKGTLPYYETVLHELAHWTGHKSRLDRSLKNVFGSDDYAKEELIAELCSAFLCADLGFSMNITNSAAYIQDWIRVLRSDYRYIFKAIRFAEEAARFIHSHSSSEIKVKPKEDEAGAE